jgi:hypothetical protein
MKKTASLLAPVLLASTAALAAPPDACSLISLEEVNKMAKGGDAVRFEKRGGGKQSECNFLRKGGDAVLTVNVRESADPAGELKMDAGVQERMYRKPVKPVAGVGDEAWYADNQGVLAFRKGKSAGQVYFTGSKYGGEPVTTEVAKLVVGRIK